MGNFTINHYSALTVTSSRVDLRYVLDMAEIPTFAELQTIHSDGSAVLSAAEQTAYLDRMTATLLAGLSLTLDGRSLPLAATGARAVTFPPGAGGLPTMRLELAFTARLGAAHAGSLAYRDDNYATRIGWKEIVATGADGIRPDQSTVPARDLSAALTHYPPDRIDDPPGRHRSRVRLRARRRGCRARRKRPVRRPPRRACRGRRPGTTR